MTRPATIKLGRFCSLRTPSGADAEFLVVAVEIGREALVSQVVDAGEVVDATVATLLAEISDARPLEPARLRSGWSTAVVCEVIVPLGTATARGYKSQRSKL